LALAGDRTKVQIAASDAVYSKLSSDDVRDLGKVSLHEIVNNACLCQKHANELTRAAARAAPTSRAH